MEARIIEEGLSGVQRVLSKKRVGRRDGGGAYSDSGERTFYWRCSLVVEKGRLGWSSTVEFREAAWVS